MTTDAEYYRAEQLRLGDELTAAHRRAVSVRNGASGALYLSDRGAALLVFDGAVYDPTPDGWRRAPGDWAALIRELPKTYAGYHRAGL